MGDYSFKGSSVDRKFSFGNLVKIIQQHQKQALYQQQAQERKQETQPEIGHKQTAALRNIPSQQSRTQEKDLAKGLVNGLGKIAEILLQPEYGSNGLPYEFTQAAYENEVRKRKRQKQQHDQGLSR